MEKERTGKKNADFLFGIIVILFSVAGYVFAEVTISNESAALMPKLVLAFMAVMGVGISGSGILQQRRGKEETKVSLGEITGGILLPGAYLLAAYGLIHILGFYMAEFLLIIALMYLQEWVTNGRIAFSVKRLAAVLGFALCSMGVMYGIFHFIFALPTPKGVLGF